MVWLRKRLIFIPLSLFVLLFFIVPLVDLLRSSVSSSGGWTIQHYVSIFQNSFILQAFQNSIQLSFVSAVIALVVTLFAVYAMSLFGETFRTRALLVTNVLSNVSGIPLAFAFIVLLGNSGVFLLLAEHWGIPIGSFSLYSWTGLLFIYVYFQLPLALLLLYPVMEGLKDDWKEAASLLGASPFQFWRRIGIPIIWPSIVGTFSILFANAMGAYASAYALTGSNYNLVAIRIGALLSGDIFAQPELASAIAVLLGVVMVIALILSEWTLRKTRGRLE
ncbi:ABC transporter permease subunit [Savagea sp. SN6]|uniref:ABC transporter permease subunit n=1 Tax=Savagea serpentis TaxID=2785297 RepID=A0A8J7G7X0_9BACL|nr:ABC transporter permease subunit [Savagea serpentis]MBF4501931.1 ABC transporter permease subunit [Savagea serpentis]